MNEQEQEPEIPEVAEAAKAAVAEVAKPTKEALPSVAEKPAALQAGDIKAMIEQEIKPWREAHERHGVTQKLGLTDDAQIDLVLEIAKKHDISLDRAHLIARAENPDKFQKQGYDPRRHGILPPTGTSPNRNNAPKEPSYEDRLKACGNNTEQRQAVADGEFKKRVLGTMARHYGVTAIN